MKQIVELASQHGIRLDANDPALGIVLLNRLVLEHSADEIAQGIRTGLLEFEESMRKVQTRAGQLVAAEFKDRVFDRARLVLGSGKKAQKVEISREPKG